MANHKRASERYNDRMQKISENARRIEREALERGQMPNPSLTTPEEARKYGWEITGREVHKLPTAGEWRANGLPDSDDPDFRLACAIWAGDKPICTTNFEVGKYKALSPEEQHANCCLMSAAKEMREALEFALCLDLERIDAVNGAGLRKMIKTALQKVKTGKSE